MKRANAWALLSALASAIGCATLPSVPEGTCGNLVVDGNEDCEQFSAEEGTRCGASGKGACRFVCGASAENARCPTGFACGTDGLCRTASGSFDNDVVPTFAMASHALGAADFDGDGRSEIVSKGPRATTVFGLELGIADARASLRQRASFLSSDVSFPALGSLEAGGRADLALVRSLGFISLWRGEPSGALAPTFYAAFPVTGDEFRLFTAEVLPGSIDAFYYGREVLVAVRIQDQFALAYLQPPTTVIHPVAPLPAAPSALAGTQRAARLAEALPCDVQVIAFANASSVSLVPLCRPHNGTFEANDLLDFDATQPGPPTPHKRHVAPTSVGTGAYVVGVGGVIVFDVDGDGHLDLLIDGVKPGQNDHTTLLAFGLGDGRFHNESWKGKPIPTNPSNVVGVAAPIDCGKNVQRGFPLAVGHLTRGDDRLDGVFEKGVCYRTSMGERFFEIADDGAMREAAIGDINGNGIDDVVAASKTSLEIFSGTGEFSHRFTVPTSEKAGHIALGDVDGDLIQDIAYRDSPEGVESVVLMFGRASAGPEAPVTLGTIAGEVEQILVNPVNSNVRNSDELADIGVVSSDRNSTTDPYSVALLQGTTDRQLEAPFSVGDNEVSSRPRHSFATLLTAGHFLPGALDSLAVVAGEVPSTIDEIWLVPVDAKNRLDAKKMRVTRGAFAGKYRWKHARSIATDLDRVTAGASDGEARAAIEELVIVAPGESVAQQNRLFVARAKSEREDAFTVTTLEIPGPGAGRAEQPFDVVSADFDGDGVADIAVRSEHDGPSRVNVFFNDGAGSLLKEPVQVTLDGQEPLAIATCALRANTKVMMVAWSDKTVRAVTFAQRVPTVGSPLLDAPGVKALVGADVDGDGVDDLTVAQSGLVSVHYGAPQKR